LATAPSLAVDPVPSEVVGNRSAVAQWRRVVRAAPWLRELDRMPVVALCWEWSGYVDALARARRGGLRVKRGTGGVGISPYVSIARWRLAAYLRLASDLGLTPSARSRVALPDAPPGDDGFVEFDRPN
jgi:P27 family predicted phage terminase small subunit